jgi:acyl-CoA synthetase (AMP-forming)/AMP-acid ligase II
VLEAAVFGVPSEKWGESPIAAVTLHKPGTATPEELKAWINENVGAKFQRVQDVLILNELPRNIAGKVLKRVMREQYSGR